MVSTLGLLLGCILALFISAGQYKAAFSSLPDLTLVTLSAGLGVAAFRLLLSRRIGRASQIAVGILTVLAILSLLSTLLNPFWDGWAVKLARYLAINGWAFIAGSVVGSHIRSAKAFVFTLFGISIAISLVAFATNRGATVTTFLSVDFTNYLGVARLSAIGALTAFALWQTGQSFYYRMAWLAVTLLLGVFTFATGGRGPTLGLGLVLLVSFFLAAASGSAARRWGRYLPVLFLLVLAGWVGARQPDGIFAFTLYRFMLVMSGDLGASFIARFDRLHEGLNLWGMGPIMGNGPNSFPAFYGGDLNETPHNLLVEIGAEFGVLSLIVVAGTYLMVLTRLYRREYGEYSTIANAIFMQLVFWLVQVPLMGIESGKYGAASLGVGLGLLFAPIEGAMEKQKATGHV